MDTKGEIPEEELPGIIEAWRRASPRITRFWKDADNAAKQVVKPENRCELGKVTSNSLKPKGLCLSNCRPDVDLPMQDPE